MRSFIYIVSNFPTQDNAGFVTNNDTVLASVRACKEERHGNESWKNRAAFTKATCLFLFRKIPGLTVDTTHAIICGDDRYNIVSAEDVRGRGMYIEALCEIITPSGG